MDERIEQLYQLFCAEAKHKLSLYLHSRPQRVVGDAHSRSKCPSSFLVRACGQTRARRVPRATTLSCAT